MPEVAMQDITQIAYTSDSGSILPELQWHERITITANTISFVRNGKAASTHVNVGAWEWAANAQAVKALFAQLAAINSAAIKRLESDDPPDGGSTETYTVTYGRGQTCSLVFDPGGDYIGGDLIVAPVWDFIQDLRLPDEAVRRYGFPAQ
jgi:hypothetical protein